MIDIDRLHAEKRQDPEWERNAGRSFDGVVTAVQLTDFHELVMLIIPRHELCGYFHRIVVKVAEGLDFTITGTRRDRFRFGFGQRPNELRLISQHHCDRSTRGYDCPIVVDHACLLRTHFWYGTHA